MRGYGVLGSIGRFLLPIAKNLASSVGTEGVEAGTRILKDVSEGKNLSESLKEHLMKGIKNLGEKMKQCGKFGHCRRWIRNDSFCRIRSNYLCISRPSLIN